MHAFVGELICWNIYVFKCGRIWHPYTESLGGRRGRERPEVKWRKEIERATKQGNLHLTME